VFQSCDDADAHAPARPAVPLLRLSWGEPQGHDTCPVRSIAAGEVEGLVLGQIRRLLASPELVARTIIAVRRENSAAEDTELKEGDVIEALGALDPGVGRALPAEQALILRLLNERIDVAPDGIS
jgi:site-specific DNA recombinase